MNFGLKLKAGALMETLNLSLSRVEDLGPPLKQFGKEKRAEIKLIFETQGGGQWPAWAASTVAKRNRTGLSKLTKRGGSKKYGGARAGYVKFLQSQAKGLQTHLENQKKRNLKAHPFLGRLGIVKAKPSPKFQKLQRLHDAAQAKLTQLAQKAEAQISADRRIREEMRKLQKGYHAVQRRLSQNPPAAQAAKLKAAIDQKKQAIAKLRPQLSKAAKGDIRRRGKLASTKQRRMLGKIGQSVGAHVQADGKSRGFLVILDRLQTPILGKVHNDGGPAGKGSQMPMRKHLELTPKNVGRLKEILIAHGLAPLQGRL